jgi:hypothetical protein
MRKSIAVLCLLFLMNNLKAQKNSDSLQLATTFKELISICKNVDLTDPNVTKLGTFYKAAPYIIYRGKNKKREWKDLADYSNEEEKKEVDAICNRINNTVNQDTSYKIVQYLTKLEYEGKWHVLIVSYMRKGIEKHTAFAFLKIGKKFGLGDID